MPYRPRFPFVTAAGCPDGTDRSLNEKMVLADDDPTVAVLGEEFFDHVTHMDGDLAEVPLAFSIDADGNEKPKRGRRGKKAAEPEPEPEAAEPEPDSEA